jgi:hypothetical protein
MSKSALSAPSAEVVDDELPEEALKLHRQGLTPFQIARQLLVSVPDVHEALDRILPKVDAAYRSRSIRSAVADLDRIVAVHMEHCRDPDSAGIVVRAYCEKRNWIGITTGTDPTQVLQQASGSRESSTAALERSLARLCGTSPKPEVGGEVKEQPNDAGDSD